MRSPVLIKKHQQPSLIIKQDRGIVVIIHLKSVIDDFCINPAGAVIIGSYANITIPVNPPGIGPFMLSLEIDRPGIGEPAPGPVKSERGIDLGINTGFIIKLYPGNVLAIYIEREAKQQQKNQVFHLGLVENGFVRIDLSLSA
jgi:hypothetical protein